MDGCEVRRCEVRRCGVWALLAAGLLVAACAADRGQIRFETGAIAKEYVPVQIRSAMESIGYTVIPFKSYRTEDQAVKVRYDHEEVEIRFRHDRDPTMTIITYFNRRTTVVDVEIWEDGSKNLGPRGEAVLAEVRAALRRSFGPAMIP